MYFIGKSDFAVEVLKLYHLHKELRISSRQAYASIATFVFTLGGVDGAKRTFE